MSYGKRNSPESSKAGRKASRSQLNSTRLLPAEQVMGDADNFEDDLDGYVGTIPLAKPSKTRRAFTERMGREVRIKQSRLLQDMELDDGYPSNKRKF